LEGFFGFVFSLGLLVGLYDNVENNADLTHSAHLAGGTVYAVADGIGQGIESAGSGPIFGLAGGAVRWGITIPIGFTAGAGAFVGNFATGLGKAILERLQKDGAPSQYALVNTLNLNLRSGPGTGFPVVAVMPQGLRAKIIGQADNGWLELDVPGSEGQTYHGFANPNGLNQE
jgi:uncharacterized protein YgiM (DUF1202 family)